MKKSIWKNVGIILIVLVFFAVLFFSISGFGKQSETDIKEKIKAELSGRAASDDLLAVKFQVQNQNPGKDMYIRINGQTNRLSSQEGYEYANGNYSFSYTVTLEKGKKEVTFTLGPGRYVLENVQAFSGNLENLGEETLYENPLSHWRHHGRR